MKNSLLKQLSSIRACARAGAIVLGVILVLTLCLVNLYAAPVTVGSFTVDYVNSSDWGSGATINVTLTNNGPAINGWTVGWTFPGNQTITNSWNATYTQSGAAVTVKNVDFNASLSTGGSTSFGFNINYSGTNAAPTSFTVNSSTPTNPTPTPTRPRTSGTPPTPTPRTATPTPTRTGVTPTPTRRVTSTPTPTQNSTDGPAVDPALRSQCTGSSPIYFHMGLAPGNYDITVVLGDSSSSGSTQVRAEARRMMFAETATSAGTLSRQTFTVNVREPEGQPTGQGGTGISGLDLYFAGSNPKLNGLGYRTAVSPQMVYLCGDSTTCDQPAAPYAGWGQMLPQYCKLGLCIANYGDSGENSGSFLSSSALFPAVEKLLKSGDYVFVQFGHNDKTTTEATFRSNLTSYITRVRAKGAIPVFVTSPVRRSFTGSTLNSTGLIVNSLGVDCPAVMRSVAAANNVPVIDLTTMSKNLVESLGPTGSQAIYLTTAKDGVSDNTHFCEYGANQMALLVIQGIKSLNLTAITSKLR